MPNAKTRTYECDWRMVPGDDGTWITAIQAALGESSIFTAPRGVPGGGNNGIAIVSTPDGRARVTIPDVEDWEHKLIEAVPGAALYSTP